MNDLAELTGVDPSTIVGYVESEVTDADTAQALGSGDVPVLGTPRMIAIAEAATVAATVRRLPEHLTTVGTRIDMRHRAPTAVGRVIVAEAVLSSIEDRRLRFRLTVTEKDRGVAIADGGIERVVLDRREFLERTG